LKKSFIIFLILIFIFSYSGVAFAETETEAEPSEGEQLTPEELIDAKPIFNESKVKAESVMLIDAKTGLVMYELDSEKPIYPASTTKIMTCLVALEETEMSEVVTCGTEVVFPPEYSVMGLVPGETVTVRDLIYGLMLISGNDAANALAVYIGGSVNGFSKMMNTKAIELGMPNTNFKNPHGAHDENHFTTASDMSKLSVAAYNNPDFMEIVGTTVYQPEDNNVGAGKNLLDNTNRLIRGDIASYKKWYNEYATGMKTGYVMQAGYCLVASASKDGQDIIALIFGHENKDDRFTLANELFAFGYDNYASVDLSNILKDSIIREAISNAKANDPNGGYMEFIPNIPDNSYYSESNNFITALKANIDEINPMVDLDADLRAPIIKGEIYGKVIFEYRGKILTRSELVAAYDMLDYSTDYLTFEEDPNIEIAPPKDIDTSNAPEWWWMIFPSMLILFILYKTVTYNRKKYKRKQKYTNYSQ
jgi:serine-type D-Ala-D-Ala carboxypeptidase (penicillin-binding protein 5/6)